MTDVACGTARTDIAGSPVNSMLPFRRVGGPGTPDAATDWVDAMQFRGRHSLEVQLS